MKSSSTSTCLHCGKTQVGTQVKCAFCHVSLVQPGTTLQFAKGELVQVDETVNETSLDDVDDFDAADTQILSHIEHTSFHAQSKPLSQLTFPHYKINKVLGVGGMGTVYQAQDLSLGRFVAIKLFHCSPRSASEGHLQLLEEARLACKLNHPNIVTIYDIARGEQCDFFVMEWVDGSPLNKLLPAQGFELLKALEYGLQILDGLAFAHKNQIIHRDIKPQNIMVTGHDRIKILDFGIASLIHEVNDPDNATQSSGTWLYMAPEQMKNERLDARADLFAFGMTFYEVLTGQQPFQQQSQEALIRAIENADYKRVTEVQSELPVELNAILAKLLQVEKAKRYQSAEAIIQDLLAIQRKLTARKSWWQKRHWASKIALVLPVIFLLGLSIQQLLFPPTTQELVARQLQEAKKIALLPFDNVSGDPTLQVFADATISSLGSDLTRIGYEQGDGSIWVIPATEIRSLNESSAKAVFEKYAADLVVRGSIQHMGSTRRIVLNLLNGRDGRILATSELSIPREKLFEGQTDVRNAVLDLLSWSVSENLQAALQSHRPQLDGAYKAYLEGLGYLYRFDQPNNLIKAHMAFKQAIEIEDSYTQAYVELAKTQLRLFS
ncbi:serine/threonine protein kinase [Pseudoalteromonas luteoviolacea B = ATCC 29581]|nr:serine/threonine protein kinase [Pseudoalteromonas luteoviolacea B = ATCC 29581]